MVITCCLILPPFVQDVFGFFVYTDTVQWYFPLQPGSDVHDTILRCISTMFLKDTITKVIWNAKGCLRPLMQIIPSQPHRWTQFRDPQLAAWLLHTDCDEKDLIFKTVCSNYGVLIQGMWCSYVAQSAFQTHVPA